MSENFDDIIKEIKKTSAVLNVKLPSQETPISVKPISLQQQRMIIESSVDNTLGVLFFNTIFYKILEENIGSRLNFINTIDRVSVALELRNKISSKIVIDDVEYNLNDVIIYNSTRQYDVKPATFTTDKFIFHVNVPSLELDNRVNALLLKKYKDDEIRRSKIKSLIGDLFVYEILKFIEKIEIVSTGTVLDLRADLNNSLKAIESIDSDEFVNVVRYINNIRDVEKSYTNIPGTATYIDIVPDFFVV